MSIDELKQVLSYDQNTGEFTWTDKASYKCFVGKKAGSIVNGYIAIRYKRKAYKAHRLAWAFVHGYYPQQVIDHINGNKSDNRIINLRDVSRHENQQNIKTALATNKSGYLGVSPADNKWKATIRVSGQYKYLGVFDTPELAHAAYLDAKREFHKGCTI